MSNTAAPAPDRDEIRRELDAMEHEFAQGDLPPSDWRTKVNTLLERSRRRLEQSPIGQGRL
jgi:hypothetical protein